MTCGCNIKPEEFEEDVIDDSYSENRKYGSYQVVKTMLR
jgi:hypothetical protein